MLLSIQQYLVRILGQTNVTMLATHAFVGSWMVRRRRATLRMYHKGVLPTLFALVVTLRLDQVLEFVRAIACSRLFEPMISGLSALVSTWVYAHWFGWMLAALFMVLFAAHEGGHLGAARLAGKSVMIPYFIPIAGAFQTAPRDWTKFEEAVIAAAGPLLGSIAVMLTIACWMWAPLTPAGQEIAIAGAFLASCLNLINMMPVAPLDGGRIAQAISWWFKVLGLCILFAFSYFVRDPFVLILWIIVMGEFRMRPILRFGLAVIATTGYGFIYLLHATELSSYQQATAFVDVTIAVVLARGFYQIWKYREAMRAKRHRRDGLRPSIRFVLFLLWIVLTVVNLALFRWTALHLPVSYRPELFL